MVDNCLSCTTALNHKLVVMETKFLGSKVQSTYIPRRKWNKHQVTKVKDYWYLPTHMNHFYDSRGQRT